MGLSFRTNIPSLKAQLDVARTSADLSDTFARLSSGLRINDASDDPAGLALAEKLKTDGRVAAVAIRNANDGLSLAATADAALGEVSNILGRMLELATQSSNGIFTNSQRSAISSEFLALGSEIDRISRTTTFNGLNLLSGSQNITLQVGFTSGSDSQITMTGVLGTLAALGLSSSAAGNNLTYSVIDTTSAGAAAAALVALSVIGAAMNSLSGIRGTLGASMSRLNRAINNLSNVRDNYLAAESKIRDVDVAQEVANMVRLQVLQKAGTAVLAQANQQPSLVLSLLQ